jgi:L-malate glycosyltransferase
MTRCATNAPRVLYVNHTSTMSGGEYSLMALIQTAGPRVRAAVACPHGELADAVRESDIPVHLLPPVEGSLKPHVSRTPTALAQIARAGRIVRKHVGSLGVDLVHANSVRAGLVVAAAGNRLPPRVVHVRDCLPPGFLSRRTIRMIDARSEIIVANSAYTRQCLRSAKASVRVLHNAVDLDRFPATIDRAAARRRVGVTEGGPVLAVVAQITPWKAQDDAIRTTALLRDEFPGVQLLVVGAPKFSGPATRYDNRAFEAHLLGMVGDLKLEGAVHFLGDRADVPEILRATDMLLVPSWEEPFGRTVIEAMAAGVPVAATAVGGPAEILTDGREGFLMPPRDPDAWARRLRVALRSPTCLARMGARGRARAAKDFSLEGHVDDVVALYGQLLASWRQSGFTRTTRQPSAVGPEMR